MASTRGDAGTGKLIGRRLPADWCLMPIGGTLMGMTTGEAMTTTKDVDLVVLAAEGSTYEIPTTAELMDVAGKLSRNAEARKDQTSVRIVLEEEERPVTVEFVRGRGASAGYFVTRRVLKAAANLARRNGNILELPPEALAFLKAWAAHDKEKLVASGKDTRGYHARRRSAFLDDVRRIRQHLRDSARAPDPALLDVLFTACGVGRQEAIRRILRDEGWEV